MRIRNFKAAGYVVPLRFRGKRSRPIRVTTVISSKDEGQTSEAAITNRRCLAATFSLMIARLHCSINSRRTSSGGVCLPTPPPREGNFHKTPRH